MYILQNKRGVLMNHEIITNELNENTKLLIDKVEKMKAEKYSDSKVNKLDLEEITYKRAKKN